MGGNVARIEGEERCIQGFVGKPEGRRSLGRPGIDGSIILRWILRMWDGGYLLLLSETG